jgi:hypothetical protein
LEDKGRLEVGSRNAEVGINRKVGENAEVREWIEKVGGLEGGKVREKKG